MEYYSISQEQPGCSHGPETINKINKSEEKKEDGVRPQELVTTCVVSPQDETTVSKDNAFHFIQNCAEKCILKGTDNILKKDTFDEHLDLNNNESNTSKEIAIHEPKTESTTLIKPNENETAFVRIGLPHYTSDNSGQRATRQHPNFPLILISRQPSFIVDHKHSDPITTQPQAQPMLPTPSILLPRIPNPNSETPSSATVPPSLFIQALSKINQSNLSLTLLTQLQDNIVKNSFDAGIRNVLLTQPEISAPSSVMESAPPSYSFVLRQNSRRPQLMGTFIPSPSFIPLTPPPNYAAAFDIYVDNGVPPPRPRLNYGFIPMAVVCPLCGVAGISVTHSKITPCTHLSAILMCLFCCWLCVPLPYLLNSCKDVYHYCGNCRNFLGMYCPTNPESASSFA